jgi:hypothetical protein
LYLLQRYPKYGVQEIERHATSLALVEGSARHEAAQLVKNTFGQLSLPTQENILLQMDAGPDEEEVRKWFAFIGKEATPESLAQFGTVWRAQRFALVADQVPAAWTERVNEIIKSAGTVRQLEATDDKAVLIGPSGPKTTEQLDQLGPDGVIAYLRTWRSAEGEESTPEGLGRSLEALIINHPEPYAERAEAFDIPDPTYVRFLFSGLETALRQGKSFPWEPVIRLAKWASINPGQYPEGQRS